MTTLVFQSAGSVIGGMLGGPIGAMIGQAVGAAAGAYVDNQLFGQSGGARHVEGPRLSDLNGVQASEGAPIPRVYGRARVGGQIIWATRFEEVATTTRQGSSGGKGGKPKATTTSYSYFVSLAIGLCEGPIAGLRRVWADGKEVDLDGIVLRVHRGDETQSPDPLILAMEGGVAPAYRGLAYVVFERFPLDDYGARVPQFSFEVIRPVCDLSRMLRGVALIPGASEFAYHPETVTAELSLGVSKPENRHQLQRAADASASLDALRSQAPNARSVAFVVSWFGDDLRAGSCTIAPRVETDDKITLETEWSVAGLDRFGARVVSVDQGRPAYGGTPSDASVVAAVADMKARGLSVVFYPFVMMDVPADNARPDPYGGARQAPYPWRGRVTCDPAPGRPGSPVGSAAAAAQIAPFFGSAAPGPDEWSYRRLVLHYANLCAGLGVDAFIIGSELIGLTRVRSAPGVYPAVAALRQLAQDVRAILGPLVKIGYSADWTEYGAHALPGGELRFPLDPLFASPAVDFVGVDAYWPLSDWRDGADHADAQEAPSIYDRAFLARRVASGEDFDWFYPDAAARAAQSRAPIADGSYGEPWVYRTKDLVGWWSNAHHERVGGARLATPTAWVAKSKPIWLIEIGCPAVDRGANQPNVFPDPKSSESAQPRFSRGERDDLMMIAALEAIIARFDPDSPVFDPAGNPLSPIYGGRMVEPSRIHAWAWDARPFPAFPLRADAWGDAANFEKGHWLNGRIESAPLDALIRAILSDFGAPPEIVGELSAVGHVDGYVVDRPMSARAALEPLLALFSADALVRRGRLDVVSRRSAKRLVVGRDDLALLSTGATHTLSRTQESELPALATLTISEGLVDFRKRALASRRLETVSRRESRNDVAAVMQTGEALRRLDILLNEAWASRETLALSLPPSYVEVEPGDVLSLAFDEAARDFRVLRVADGLTRGVEAVSYDRALYDAPRGVEIVAEPAPLRLPGRPRVETLDLAVDPDGAATLTRAAVFADPWPGAVTLWRERPGGGFEAAATATRCAIVGETLDALPPGPIWRIDHVNALRVAMRGGTLQSVAREAMLAGANRLALRGEGGWEIVGFEKAELVGEGVWRLSTLLRGLGGEEALASRLSPPGATVVLLDEALTPLAAGVGRVGLPTLWRAVAAGRDPSDPLAREWTTTPSDLALRPYAPVHPTARRTVEGVRIAFVRRGRRDADGWTSVDIPLGEEREAYRVEILAGAQIRRVIETTTPAALYAGADELADFGASQTTLTLRIAQIGAAVGPGFAWAGALPVL
jgi:hypothetical protein